MFHILDNNAIRVAGRHVHPGWHNLRGARDGHAPGGQEPVIVVKRIDQECCRGLPERPERLLRAGNYQDVLYLRKFQSDCRHWYSSCCFCSGQALVKTECLFKVRGIDPGQGFEYLHGYEFQGRSE